MYHLKLDPQWMNRLYEQQVQINVTYDDLTAIEHPPSHPQD